jgi:enterochelin esterase-like enzyme
LNSRKSIKNGQKISAKGGGMKFVLMQIIVIVSVLALSACGGGGGSSAPNTDIERGTLTVVALNSAALHATRQVKIYTPPGYNSQTKYPVLYILHGLGSDIDQWMPELGMNTRADLLIKNKQIAPLIIVAPQMDNSYGAGGNEVFLCEELISYIDSHYSTNPTRENRSIGGLSMGGFIALHNAFAHTDLFSKAGGHSAYLYTVAGLNNSIENPIVTAQNKDLTMLKVYLDTGTSDQFNLTVCLSELFGILQSKGVPSEYHPGPGGHTGLYWAANMDNYLKFYAGI